MISDAFCDTGMNLGQVFNCKFMHRFDFVGYKARMILNRRLGSYGALLIQGDILFPQSRNPGQSKATKVPADIKYIIYPKHPRDRADVPKSKRAVAILQMLCSTSVPREGYWGTLRTGESSRRSWLHTRLTLFLGGTRHDGCLN